MLGHRKYERRDLVYKAQRPAPRSRMPPASSHQHAFTSLQSWLFFIVTISRFPTKLYAIDFYQNDFV